MPRYDLVKHVADRQDIHVEIDITGLDIDISVRQLILNHYNQGASFALTDEDQETVCYFLPAFGCAVFWDGGEITLNQCTTPQQFENTVKMALTGHRAFLGSRQIEGHERYKEILEQLKQIG